MAKDLPYFKFITSEWLDGEITLEELEMQGLFINICALYWSKEGRLYLSKLKKRFRHAQESSFETLINEGFLQIDADLVSISFLDEQLEERAEKSRKNSINGKKGGRPKKQEKTQKKPNAFNSESETKANESQREKKREEKRREEKKREELFNEFWNLYGKKVGRKTALIEWLKLTDEEINQIFNHVPKYTAATEKQFRKDPERYLKKKTFLDEVIQKQAPTGFTPQNTAHNGNNTIFEDTL